jgi:hypothetical protein
MHLRMMMAVVMLAAMPAGCAEPPTAEEINASTIANCERQWTRMGGPAGKGAAEAGRAQRDFAHERSWYAALVCQEDAERGRKR